MNVYSDSIAMRFLESSAKMLSTFSGPVFGGAPGLIDASWKLGLENSAAIEQYLVRF